MLEVGCWRRGGTAVGREVMGAGVMVGRVRSWAARAQLGELGGRFDGGGAGAQGEGMSGDRFELADGEDAERERRTAVHEGAERHEEEDR